jgi:SNF family Na+-dependent transporter
MPALFLFTIIIVGWTMSLEGAKEAIFSHYLHADWTKINLLAADPAIRSEAGKVWAAAFGQIFFTLLIIAGLTSGVSLIEAFTCAITDKFDIKRMWFSFENRILFFLEITTGENPCSELRCQKKSTSRR